MAINFPDNPTINDEFSVDNFSWIWNGTTWDFAGGAAGGATITASATAPLDPQEGEGWFNTSTSVFSIYYNSEWVEVSGGASISASDIPPSEPELGEAWYNSSDGRLYIYYDSFWVEANPALVGDPGIVASATAPENLNILWLDTSESSTAVLPAGGTAGQKLIKSSDTSYDTQWADLTTSDITDLSVSSTELNYVDGTTSNIQNQIDTVQSNVELRPLSHNYIINGAFDIWQRGTSISSLTNDVFLADRWATRHSGSPAIRLTQREELTPADINVIGYGEGKYYIRQLVAGSVTYVRNTTKIEDVRTLAGQEITISFWARSSGSVTGIPVVVQDFGTGGSSATANFIGSSATLTSNWQRFTFTEAIDSIAGKTIGVGSNLTIIFQFEGLADGTVDFWGAQLEAGSVATPFKRHASSLQLELAACQRYYKRVELSAAGGIGQKYAATAESFLFNAAGSHNPPMRISNPDASAITPGTYQNCTFVSMQSYGDGFTHRVQASGQGYYRAYDQKWQFEAEL